MQIRWIALFLCLAVTGWLASSFIQGQGSPDSVKDQTIAHLSNHFPNVHIEKASKLNGQYLLENITLDRHDFSSIKFIQIGKIGALGVPEKITLKNVILTGELEGQDLSIAGLETLIQQPLASALDTNIKDISIQNLKLDLSTAAGIIRVEANIDAKKINGSYVISALVWAKQKQFTIESNWSGTLTSPEKFDVTADIHSAKFDFRKFQATRASGKISIKHNTETPEISGQLRAGAFRILGIPFMNGKLDISNNNKQKRLALRASGHSFVDKQDAEHTISLNSSIAFSPFAYKATLTTPNAQNLIYSISDNFLPDFESEKTRDFTSNWPLTESPATLIIQGPVDNKVNTQQLTLNVDKFPIPIIANLYQSDTNDHILRTHPITFTTDHINNFAPQSLQDFVTPKSGEITLMYHSQLSHFESEDPQKFAFSIAPQTQISFNNFTGKIFGSTEVTSLYGSTYIHNGKQPLPLKAQKISHPPFTVTDAKIFAHVDNSQTLKIDRITKDGWSLQNIAHKDQTQTATLVLSNLPLENLINLPHKGLCTTDAIINATIPVSWQTAAPQKISIHSAIVEATGPGKFKLLSPPQKSNALTQKQQHLQAIQIALQNYDFKKMNLKIDMKVNNSPHAIFSASGTNRPSFGDRPIDIEINLGDQITPYLQYITSPTDALSYKITKDANHDAAQ